MQTKSEGMEKHLQTNRCEKKAWVAILTDKTDFKTKTITRDKEECYIITKGAL